MKKFRFKTVAYKDYKILFNWRNEREVRINSFNKKKIDLKNHKNWLKRQLKKKKDYFWFFLKNGKKIGLVRLSYINNKFILNYMISKEFRKKKLANKMLIFMLKKIKQKKNNNLNIIAQIKHNNIISKKSLLGSGFEIIKKTNKYINFKYSF